MADTTANLQGGTQAPPGQPAPAAAAGANPPAQPPTVPPAAAAGTQTGKQGTQNDTPRTYSEAEAQEMVSRLIQEARTEMGRQFKPVRDELETTKATAAQVPVLQAQLKVAQEQSWADEIEASKDKPEAFNVVKRKHELDQREIDLATQRAELDQTKAKLKTDSEEITAWKAQKAATDVAARYNLNADVLFSIVPDGDESRLESVAKTLTAGGHTLTTPPPGNGGQPGKDGVVQGKPDGGLSLGGETGSLRNMIDRARGK